MNEEISIDEQQFHEQFKQACEENGIVVTICIPSATMEEICSHSLYFMPNIKIRGNATPLDIASLILTMTDVIKDLLENDDVSEELINITNRLDHVQNIDLKSSNDKKQTKVKEDEEDEPSDD